MKQSTQDYEDMFAGISPEILKNIFIRFYTTDEYFQFLPNECRQSEDMESENVSKKNLAVALYFNRLIQEVICDLYIMNKLISEKAKCVSNLFENGRAITAKKNAAWLEFLKEPGFESVQTAFSLLSPAKRNLIKYSIISISNLLLKLSINMSKVSVICTQRFLTPQCLSVPVLSVIFLQHIQYFLFKTKNITTKDQQLNFLKQLPKITFVCLNQHRNNTHLKLLENSQERFINRQVQQSVKNLQYIELYEKSDDPFLPHFQRQTKYQYFYSASLEQMGAQAPFSFEVLELMRQIVFPLVKDFKPDLIVYMESYPNESAVMDDETRGLLLCEMAEETGCNKMYVFKEMGINKLQSIKANKLQEKVFSEAGQNINEEVIKCYDSIQLKTANKFNTLKLLNDASEQKKLIERMKKNFLNELCYVSLALIQKTSFENILQASHKHFFKRQFLEGILMQHQTLIKQLEQRKTQEALVISLKTKREGVKMMLEVLRFKQEGAEQKGFKIINLINNPSYFSSFYNIMQKCSQPLKAENQSHNLQDFTYGEEDNLIVHYYDTEAEKKVRVIIIKYVPAPQQGDSYVQMVVLSKQAGSQEMKLEARFHFNPEQNYIEGATYVCSPYYLYRGFGRFRLKKSDSALDDYKVYNRKIERIQINPPVSAIWEEVAEVLQKPAKGQSEANLMEKKINGYGLYDPSNKAIVMMGGYLNSCNDEKISKNMYIIKGDQHEKEVRINILGKTNKIVYNSNENMLKMFLHPFVFGIPFSYQTSSKGSSAFVLNSNGYYLNLNHCGKIFGTVIKLSQVVIFNGINMQAKLEISPDLDKASTAIFLAEVLVKCMVLHPHQLNTKGTTCCVETLDEGLITIELGPDEKDTRRVLVQAPKIFEDHEFREIRFI